MLAKCALFDTIQAVVELIKQHFEERKPHIEDKSLSTIPTFPVPPHEEPHFSCFGETEAGVVRVYFLVPNCWGKSSFVSIEYWIRYWFKLYYRKYVMLTHPAINRTAELVYLLVISPPLWLAARFLQSKTQQSRIIGFWSQSRCFTVL